MTVLSTTAMKTQNDRIYMLFQTSSRAAHHLPHGFFFLFVIHLYPFKIKLHLADVSSKNMYIVTTLYPLSKKMKTKKKKKTTQIFCWVEVNSISLKLKVGLLCFCQLHIFILGVDLSLVTAQKCHYIFNQWLCCSRFSSSTAWKDF